jgi:lysozyme
MKKLVFVLALLFLLEWAYTTKIKPFIIAEFGPFNNADSLPAKPDKPDTTGKSGATGKPYKPGAGFTYGLDIFHGSGNGYEVSLIDKTKDSISFVICKATEGDNFADPKFKENWQILKQKGIIRGAYHFYKCDHNPLTQAAFFLKTIHGISNDDLPPVIDIESDAVHSGCTNIGANILIFLKEIESKLQRKPMIYVNMSDGDRFLRDSVFSTYPLWVAYPTTTRPEPKIPDAWSQNKWMFWQRSDKYEFDGNNSDFDVFRGSIDDLKDFIRGTVLK